MYDMCHPSYYYITKLGCSDPVKMTTTFYVYLELCEEKRFFDVQYKYNKELDLLYFEVKKTHNSVVELYIPWPLLHKITLEYIEKIQEHLQCERLTFVFKSADSSSISYKVSSGLVKLLPPEISKKMREKEEKKVALEEEIRRNTSNLYDLAKSLSKKNAEREHQPGSSMDDKMEIAEDD